MNAFRANPKLTEVIGERAGPSVLALPRSPDQDHFFGRLNCYMTPDVTSASLVKAYGTSNAMPGS